MTIGKNIALGLKNVIKVNIIKVAKDAMAYDFRIAIGYLWYGKDNNYMKRTKFNIMFWLLIAFLTLGASMNIFFLGSSHINNADNQTFPIKITSVIEPEVEDEENTSIFNLNNANTSFIQKINLTNKVNIKNIISISTLVAILKGISFNTLLLVIFIIFYLNLFKSKPDDWTLLNQKVRLDD